MSSKQNILGRQAEAISHSPDITLVAGSIKGAMRAAGAGSRDLWFVPRDAIRVIDGFNVRIKNNAYQEHIRFLADSIKREGFKAEHPLSGYVARSGDDSVIYITDGHCRLEGVDTAISEGAEIELLPVVVASQACDLQDMTVGLALSNTGKPLEPLEKAAVCKRLVQFNFSEDKIAERLNYTIQYVKDLLLLVGSPVEIRQLVAEGKIAATTAIQMLNKHGDKALEKIKAGLELAVASGKDKVTKRFMADPGLKYVKKSAPAFYEVVTDIRKDPAYAGLDGGLREKVEQLINSIEEAKSKVATKAAAKPARKAAAETAVAGS